MNPDRVLETFNHENVEYLLIGGLNFALRHVPYTTLDIDLWIEDSDDNRSRCEAALAALDAEWGPTDATWQPVEKMSAGWLATQEMFCLSSPHGWIGIFRSVKGLGTWQEARQRAVSEHTGAGSAYFGLSDSDMLQSQLALDPPYQKRDRIATLQQKLGGTP